MVVAVGGSRVDVDINFDSSIGGYVEKGLGLKMTNSSCQVKQQENPQIDFRL